MSRDVYICDTVRTPIGRYGGSLAKVRADDLAAIPIRELLRRHPALTDSVDEVYLGCANQAGEDNRNVARMALLLAGLPETVPGVTLNRLCASGMDAVGAAARAIRAGEIELAIAGGVESMSRAPLVMGKAETEVTRLKETAKSSLYQLKLEVFQNDGDAYLRYSLADQLNPKMSLRLYHSGPGTLWTNMEGKNMSVIMPAPKQDGKENGTKASVSSNQEK